VAVCGPSLPRLRAGEVLRLRHRIWPRPRHWMPDAQEGFVTRSVRTGREDGQRQHRGVTENAAFASWGNVEFLMST